MTHNARRRMPAPYGGGGLHKRQDRKNSRHADDQIRAGRLDVLRRIEQEQYCQYRLHEQLGSFLGTEGFANVEQQAQHRQQKQEAVERVNDHGLGEIRGEQGRGKEKMRVIGQAAVQVAQARHYGNFLYPLDGLRVVKRRIEVLTGHAAAQQCEKEQGWSHALYAPSMSMPTLQRLFCQGQGFMAPNRRKRECSSQNGSFYRPAYSREGGKPSGEKRTGQKTHQDDQVETKWMSVAFLAQTGPQTENAQTRDDGNPRDSNPVHQDDKHEKAIQK